MNTLQLPASFNGPVPDPTATQQVSPLHAFSIMRRHRLAIALVTLGISVPAGIGIFSLRPYYNASSILIVGTHQAPFRDLQATVSSPEVDTVAVNSEVSILRSPAIARAVAKKLDLVNDPDFREALDHVPVSKRLVDAVSRMFVTPPVEPPMTADERLQAVSLLLDQWVTILNDGRSYIITITASTVNAATSARIANAYADVYLDFKRHMKISATWQANALLDEQIAPLRERLRKAEQAVQAFREKNGLIAAELERAPGANGSSNSADSGGTTVTDQQLIQMNRELITARGDLESRRARYTEVRNAIRNGSLDSIPDAVSSPLIQQLQAQEAQISSRAASLSQTVMDGNPDLQSVRAAAAQVRARIGAEVQRVANSAAKELSSAEARVAALSAEVDRLQGQVTAENEADVTMRQLQSEATAARTVYQDYLGRFAQTSTQAELQVAEADLISRAETPLGPYGPPRKQYMAIAILFALMMGAGSALVIERMRKGVRSTAELDAIPGLFALGLVTAFAGPLARQYASRERSAYLETVESIRSVLSFGHSRFRAKVVLVTSAEQAEGKTTFALSLAANTGRCGQRALVIDCDMRNPSAMRVMGAVSIMRNTHAPVSPLLAGLERDVLPGVDILTPEGMMHRGGGAMLLPEELGQILAQVGSQYDMILLDTPPALAFPDAAVLSRQTDGVVMVVKWGQTSAATLVQAMRTLHTYDARTLGAVLTQAPPHSLGEAEKHPFRIYSHYGLLPPT
ncbi:GumC family protein [Gluconacetobacter entanii]|uniref:non-specific protein-tyrosine kinase n=1 Tax=Gluconacetobacter entanii TaxID=108528 RepID=A0A318Q8I3_9PROT|nr:polysaccharide biosynthesis tyrosine autokinase [Gluconacetobacter entanii]PYD61655.1 succinoglycan biosynthesis protein exop [Gluconacetobacter entanii]